MPALHEYRLSRLQEQIRKHDCAGLLMFDPLNIRYAADTTNMQLWIAHNAARACFVPPEGKVVLWDFTTASICRRICRLSVRCATGPAFSISRPVTRQTRSGAFVDEVIGLMRQHGENKRLAVDKIETPAMCV